jgi:hypothetical protein
VPAAGRKCCRKFVEKFDWTDEDFITSQVHTAVPQRARRLIDPRQIHLLSARLCFQVRRDLLTEFAARIPFESFSGLS